MAGAAAVQVGTATFRNPRAALDVLEGLEAWLAAHAVERLDEITGCAHRERAASPETV
jgi:dihydroorotate dehydrogenase (NAD+) catalytic subunit